MLKHSKLIPVVALAVLTCCLGSANAAVTNAPEASLKVNAVRVSRATQDFSRRFPGIYTGDNRPGVYLQLLLTLNAGTMLPVTREAITVETLVDDTYQSLLGTGNESSYSSGENQTAVSEDARTLLFTVGTSRVPAEEAGRLFVRGSVQARVSRGEALVATNELPVAVGNEAMIGPFRTIIRSVSDSGGSGASVMLAVEGDASRIQRLRVMERGGKVLNDDRRSRFGTSSTDRPATVYLNLQSLPKDAIVLEFTYQEKTELVRIPFEAQVDIGVTKAGPIQALDAGTPARGGSRPWPPPREVPGQSMPPRRAAFDPARIPQTNAPKSDSVKLDKATVDLFSLTVAKPLPSEMKGSEWKTPPSPAFYASGFTVVRLLLSTPGADILSLAPDAVSISRFEDDKGGQLDTAVYRETSPSYSSSYSGSPSSGTWPYVRRSTDGQQTLLHLSLATAPTPGATRCTLAGKIQARIGRSETTNTVAALELKNGQSFTAGPFTGRVETIRQSAPSTPATRDGAEIELWLSLKGPVARLRLIEFLDSAGKPMAVLSTATDDARGERAETRTLFRFSTPPTGSVGVRVRYYESDEMVQVPFELSTGIGL